MPTVAATCPYVPLEWIAAHGLRPVRVVPSATCRTESVRATAGLCPYARACANALPDGPRPGAAVFTTACDQMRRLAEVFADRSDLPTFVMNVPATWQTPAALDLYTDELRRLGRFLVGAGGTAPKADDLVGVMRAYDAARERLQAARDTLTPRQYSEAWAQFDPEAALPAPSPDALGPADAVPLALAGGPMLQEQFGLFDLVERLGGRIVLTAVEGGRLTAPGPFDPDRIARDPLAELARAYHAVPHPMRRPDTPLGQWLDREMEAAAPRGILFLRYLWCDLWHVALARLKERTALPVLDMDIADHDVPARLAGKVQAFIETLQ